MEMSIDYPPRRITTLMWWKGFCAGGEKCGQMPACAKWNGLSWLTQVFCVGWRSVTVPLEWHSGDGGYHLCKGEFICDDSTSVVLHAWSRDIHGQDLKAQSLWGEFPVWKPLNFISALCWYSGSAGFFRPWTPAGTGASVSSCPEQRH